MDVMCKIDDSFFTSGTILSSGKGRFLVGFGKRTWMIQPDLSNQEIPYFFSPSFFLTDEKPWFMHEFFLEITLNDLQAWLKQKIKASNFPLQTVPRWVNRYSDHFSETFAHLQKKIATKELSKAVPFVFEQTSELMTKDRLKSSLGRILNYSKDFPLHIYGFWDNHEGILGSTPEILFRIKKKGDCWIETMACAGTRQRNSPDGSLLNDPKELHEHDLVVQSIVKDLSPFGSVLVGNLQILELPKLLHLVTPLQVLLKNEPTYTEIVQALHPTPALGAYPRHAGMVWLKQYETIIPRRRFGAPLGYIFSGKKKAECYVAIRNVQWNAAGMAIGAGCGIVSESLLKREWQEIQLKIQSIKDLLAL